MSVWPKSAARHQPVEAARSPPGQPARSPRGERSVCCYLQPWRFWVHRLLGWAGGQDGLVTGLLSGGSTPCITGHRIGIISGHSGNDSGAVCDDGRKEVDTVRRIAEKVARRLERSGASVDILAEYDERLNGYVADALVSIHADLCIDRSGFKVACVVASTKPELDDYLVGCLGARYAEATGIAFHASTITEDMTEYHAFSVWQHQPPRRSSRRVL